MAGYIGRRGWAEASAGNISVLLEGPGPEEPGGSFALLFPVPGLEGRRLAVTRTGCRFRNLPGSARADILLASFGPGGSCLTGLRDGAAPTSEVSAHALAHAAAARAGWPSSALIHVHAPSILALSAGECSSADLERETRMAHPEVDLLLGGAVRFLDFLPPGSAALAEATGRAFECGARAVVWRGHGAVGLGRDLDEACDAIEVVEAAADVMIRRASCLGRFGGCSSAPQGTKKGRLR